MRDDRNDRDRRNGDRERRTWREIDQLRDKSRSRDHDPMEKKSSPAALQAQKSYRAALERAFEAGTLGELAKTLTKTVEPRFDGSPKTGDGKASAAEAKSNEAKSNEAPAQAPASQPEAAPPGGGASNGQATPAGGGDAAAAPGAAPAGGETAAQPRPKDPERENRQKMLVRIRDAEGREPVTRAVDAYLARFGKLPDDYEVLTKALSHKSDDQVRAVLAQLTEMLAREKPRRGRQLSAQLRFIEDTHLDPELRKAAAEVRARL